MTELVTFTAWTTPAAGGHPLADSDWSRLAWLPVVGPTAWAGVDHRRRLAEPGPGSVFFELPSLVRRSDVGAGGGVPAEAGTWRCGRAPALGEPARKLPRRPGRSGGVRP